MQDEVDRARIYAARRRRLVWQLRIGVVALVLGTISLGFMLVHDFGIGQ